MRYIFHAPEQHQICTLYCFKLYQHKKKIIALIKKLLTHMVRHPVREVVRGLSFQHDCKCHYQRHLKRVRAPRDSILCDA